MLNYLVITTNKDRTFEIGDSESGGADFVVDIPPGFHVVGFGGGKREYIDSLWLYIRSHPDNRCGCEQSLLGNDKCDKDCYTLECAWDLGDCEKPPDCECELEKLLNGVCDPECNTEECWFDLNTCPIDGCQCPLERLGNDNCDWEEPCNTKVCKWDDGDCEYPDCHCDPLLIGNDVCNEDCNNLDCKFDESDCSGSIDCKACKFNAVGPLGASSATDVLFDDLQTLKACCDVRLTEITILLGAENVVTGIKTSYVYNYDSDKTIVNTVGTEGTPNVIPLALGETVM